MYQALYRKWRSRTFSEMVGQEAVIRTLRHQVATGRVAHAYLFCGSRGTGKTTCAKIIAKAAKEQGCKPCGKQKGQGFLPVHGIFSSDRGRISQPLLSA